MIQFANTRPRRRLEVRFVGVGYRARIFEGGVVRWRAWRPTYRSVYFIAQQRFNTKESIFR